MYLIFSTLESASAAADEQHPQDSSTSGSKERAPADSNMVEKRLEIEGDRYLESGRRRRDDIKEEEGGNGPQTFWRVTRESGPRVVDDEIIVIDDE